MIEKSDLIRSYNKLVDELNKKGYNFYKIADFAITSTKDLVIFHNQYEIMKKLKRK